MAFDECSRAPDSTEVTPECDTTTGTLGCAFVFTRLLSAREEFPDGVVVAVPDDASRCVRVELSRVDDDGSGESQIGAERIAPGTTERWTLDDPAGPTTSWHRRGGTYRIRSNAPISAYTHSPGQTATSNDSSVLLPTAALGRTYVVASYGPLGAQAEARNEPSFIETIAVGDTTLTWSPVVPTAGDGPLPPVSPGESGELAMFPGDAVRIAAADDSSVPVDRRDLTGTVVKASGPTGVASGTRCARVPYRDYPENGYCDTLQEVLVPVEDWGAEAVAAPPPARDRERHYWRIFGGGEAATSFVTSPNVLDESNCRPPATLSGGVCTLRARGSWIEVVVDHGTGFVVRGVDPQVDRLMVVGYLQSRYAPGEPTSTSADYGDTSMYQLVAPDRYARRYTLASGRGYAAEWIQLVRRRGGTPVLVDGDAVGGWARLGEFEYADVPLDGDDVVVRSDDPIGVTQFGYTDPGELTSECTAVQRKCASSYAHPAGWR